MGARGEAPLPLGESALIPLCYLPGPGGKTVLHVQACHHKPVSDTPTSSSYKGAPVSGLEVTVQIQVVRSVQRLGLHSIHGTLTTVLKQVGHVWVPESWTNFLG